MTRWQSGTMIVELDSTNIKPIFRISDLKDRGRRRIKVIFFGNHPNPGAIVKGLRII